MPNDVPLPVGTKPALLVVDVARKRADPSLDTAFPAVVEMIEPLRRLLNVSRAADLPVFFTRGGRSYYTSSGSDLTDVERGGWTRKFTVREEDEHVAEDAFTVAPALDPRTDEVILTKSMPSAFFQTMLPVYLSSLCIDTVVATGMTTSGCIRATVVDAFSHDYHVVVPESCVADPRETAHEFHLKEIDLKYGHVEPLDDVVKYVESIA